tara:strand:+ start:1056 stop:1217 length:162 start_codon:yes stop_codon:yes gene_type:complete
MSWEQLQAIIDESALDKLQEEQEGLVACPIDGEPLDIRADGVRSCPMGNFRWP